MLFTEHEPITVFCDICKSEENKGLNYDICVPCFTEFRKLKAERDALMVALKRAKHLYHVDDLTGVVEIIDVALEENGWKRFVEEKK
jgi:hypothetical protein